MKSPIGLSPLGTALAAVEAFDPGSAAERALLNWLGKVSERLRALYNLESEIAFIPWELARWQRGLGVAERQALILLFLGVLVHGRMGSTRIAFRGARGKTLRLDIAGRLLGGLEEVTDCDRLDPARAAALMESLVDSGAVSDLVGQPGAFKPLIDAGSHLYLEKMLQLEDRFVTVLKRRLAAKAADRSEDKREQALNDVLSRPVYRSGKPVDLKSEQQAAVRSAALFPVTIVSGGPGTGKTTIIVSILRMLRRMGVPCEEIALAAPTGKAANRMGEAIRAGREGIDRPAEADFDLVNLSEPQTLHRLLGFSRRTGSFQHHENNRLAESVVIVDEGSMIDLALMERLVRSLRDDSRFVLLGDAHQLPSVEAGSVLRDLLVVGEAGNQPGLNCIELTHSHRMRREDTDGLNILTVAQSIDRGTAPEFASTRRNESVIVERLSVPEVTFRGVEFISSPEGSRVLERFLDHWYQEVLRSLPNLDEWTQHEYSIEQGNLDSDDRERLKQLFEHWGRSRILCVTRVLPTGADLVNAALHQREIDRFNQSRRGSKGVALARERDFIPGEPVLMQVNDYDRGIFNGDQGIVVNVIEQGQSQLMVAFPQADGFAVFPVESLRSELLHSYAMTVHKAQGSEFDRVALILPDRDVPINSPEILYTALTRSRASVVVVGRRDIFESGIARVTSRDSGIAEKLRG